MNDENWTENQRAVMRIFDQEEKLLEQRLANLRETRREYINQNELNKNERLLRD